MNTIYRIMNIWIIFLILLIVAVMGYWILRSQRLVKQQLDGGAAFVYNNKNMGPLDPHTIRWGNHVPQHEGFIGGTSDEMTLGYGNLPYKPFPTDKKLMRSYWGPYLYGWRKRPFYAYGPNTRAPYPYQFECNDYANDQCERSCDPFCYKKNYLRCSAGVALVNPEPVCNS